MGGKHSKRETPYGSTPPRGSPNSSKVSRTRSLPTRVFSRRLSYDHGGSLKGRPVLEDLEDTNHLEEYQKLLELEKLHGKANNAATAAGFCGGTSHDIIRSCMSPLRGSREEVIYEEGDYDNVADGSESSLKDSPPLSRFAARGRLSSFSAPCLAELVGQVEGLGDGGDGNIHKPILVKPFLSAHNSPAVKKPEEEVAAQPICYAHDSSAPECQSDDIKCKTSGQIVLHPSQLAEKFEEEVAEVKHTAVVVIEASPLSKGKGNNPHVSEDQQDIALKVTSPASKEFVLSRLSGVPGSGTVYKFQAQKTPAGRRRWRRTSRCSCDQDSKTLDEGRKMSGKGKVSLSFTNSGKRLKDSRRNSFNDANDIVWGGTSAGKRIKDGIGEENVPSDMHPDAFAWGLMGQSDPFLGFDAAGFFTQLPDEEEQVKGGGGFTRRSRTPSKASRGKALARKVRGLRASPKPVSSLESCLRAQLTDENDRERGRQVSRPLNFSPPADGRGRPENGLKMIGYINGVPTSPDVTPINNSAAVGSERRSSSSSTGSVSLPNLQKVLKGFAARLAPNKVDSNPAANVAGPKQAAVEMPAGSPGDSKWKKSLLPVILKKRKISDVKHLSMGSDQGSDKLHAEELSLSSKEALLFGFGVGVGVQSASEAHQAEVQRLNQLLDEAQIQMQNLKLELESRGGSASLAGGRLDQGAMRYTRDGTVSNDLESQDQGDQMAELEAELEAELDQLTGGDSVLDSQYSVLDELDMDGVASVVYGDLKVAGLPARLEESSEDDDYSVPAQPACLNNYAVSPRLLARLLRKVQATRQAELLTELEEELEGVQSKLQSKEEELEVWKDRVRHLTEGSLTSTSGDEILTPGNTNAAKTPVERSKTPNQKNANGKTGVKGIDSLEGQESFHFPLQGASTWASGSEADTNITGPGGSSDTPVVVTSGEVETTKEDLHTDVEQNSRDTKRDAIPGITVVPAGDETCNEFLQSMIDGEEFGSSSHAEAAITQASRDCSQVMDNAQIERQLIDSVQGLEKSDYPESSEMGSATPSVCDYSSTGSLADGWDHSVDPASFQATTNNGDTGGWFRRAKLLVPHPSRRTSWNSDAGHSILVRKVETEEGPVSPQAESCTTIVKYTETLQSSKSVSEMSDSDIHYSVKYEDVSATTRTIADSCGAVPADWKGALFWEGGGRAGLNTPIEKEKVKVRQQLFKPLSREGAGLGLGFNLPTQRPLCLEGRSGDLSPTVLDKITRWEGLMEGETPGPATGSDWECQSRVSESEQCNLDLVDDDINVFGEENLVLEAEEMLGRMLINRIVEKTRAGSHIVKEAQTALASLERDDGGGGGGGGGEEDAEMNGRMTDSDTSTLSERDYDSREEGWSDDQGKETSNSFLDEAVRQEYEFFRRLELISRDRKAAKIMKEKPAKEPAYLGRLDLQRIPSLDLDASEAAFRTKEGSGVLAAVQETDSPLKEIRGNNRSAEPKNRTGENWLVRGEARQELYGGSGHREDEVRSRRRL